VWVRRGGKAARKDREMMRPEREEKDASRRG